LPGWLLRLDRLQELRRDHDHDLDLDLLVDLDLDLDHHPDLAVQPQLRARPAICHAPQHSFVTELRWALGSSDVQRLAHDHD